MKHKCSARTKITSCFPTSHSETDRVTNTRVKELLFGIVLSQWESGIELADQDLTCFRYLENQSGKRVCDKMPCSASLYIAPNEFFVRLTKRTDASRRCAGEILTSWFCFMHPFLPYFYPLRRYKIIFYSPSLSCVNTVRFKWRALFFMASSYFALDIHSVCRSNFGGGVGYDQEPGSFACESVGEPAESVLSVLLALGCPFNVQAIQF